MSELMLPLMTDTEIVDWLENYGKWIDARPGEGVALSSLTLDRKRTFTAIDEDLRRTVRRAVAVGQNENATLVDSLADVKKKTSEAKLRWYCTGIFILGTLFGATLAALL